ncbi:F-box and leucine-rich repeat protein 10/11 [Clonorchis sinensis]|uniref:F-box and leucine-rich repeat protein 10/11 n=1 Tax=Clonorchis sinensis TaxID=79923 RepID=G7Y657_CLOSI|nr:F-box and leucine-rich repeat protein 10/11 [Clonorchis sinensis]
MSKDLLSMHSSLSKLVEPPHVVSELSLISNCWIAAPDDEFGEVSDDGSFATSIPSVQKYCLMSMEGSYTDFHIDFGGSSVWYHVVWVRQFTYVDSILQGEKIFYLIPPTHDNRHAYWRWSWNPDHRTIFLPDLLDAPKDESNIHSEAPVFQLHVGPGQTILLPAGWIHAVYTPSDCLVFGGNFLNELHIPIQLSVYRMEQKSETPRKFQFPNFEKIHWFVAERIAGRLTNALYDNREPAAYEIEAAHALAKVLPRWLEKRLTLPPDERLYYLPSRATMELSYSQLIDKLEELSSILLTAPCKSRCSSIKPEKSKLNNSDKHSSGKSKSSVHEETVKQRSVCPSSTPKRSAGGGLGWLPDRAMRQKSSDVDQTVTENQPVTEDQDILDALPELNESRLIGDHCGELQLLAPYLIIVAFDNKQTIPVIEDSKCPGFTTCARQLSFFLIFVLAQDTIHIIPRLLPLLAVIKLAGRVFVIVDDKSFSVPPLSDPVLLHGCLKIYRNSDFLDLSDSDADEKTSPKRKHARSARRGLIRHKTRDPDPTWSNSENRCYIYLMDPKTGGTGSDLPKSFQHSYEQNTVIDVHGTWFKNGTGTNRASVLTWDTISISLYFAICIHFGVHVENRCYIYLMDPKTGGTGSDLPKSFQHSYEQNTVIDVHGTWFKNGTGTNRASVLTWDTISISLPNAGKKDSQRREHNSYIPNKRVRECEYVRVREYNSS